MDALRSAISKNSANFEEVSKTNNTAQVKVSATSINMESIVTEALNNTKSQILSSKISDKQKAMEMYGTNLIDAINKAQVNSATSENTFSFTKKGNIWLPSNVTSYTESILKMSIII